jgi:GNAT superfamily N-acetyltransferase
MRLFIRPGTEADLDSVMTLVADCVAAMRRDGIEQWDEIYPNRAGLMADIRSKTLHRASLEHSDALAGIVVINEFQDREYAEVPWTLVDGRVAVIHRLMVDPAHQRMGIARDLMAFAEARARELGYTIIRLDSFVHNPRALRLYPSLGYRDAGGIQLRKGPFRCFEKAL